MSMKDLLFSEPTESFADESPPVGAVACAMLFGSIIFCTASLAARSFLTGDTRALQASQDPRKGLDPTDFVSVYTFLFQLAVFGVILLYAYLCEYHPPFPHANKTYDRDEFLFMIVILVAVSATSVTVNQWKRKGKQRADDNGTVMSMNQQHNANSSAAGNSRAGSTGTTTMSRKSRDDGTDAGLMIAQVDEAHDVLNRDQTEEWKGWMQFIFLFYHYYHAEEAYNAVRVMISSYVWMTGFGNFSFFYLKGDYGTIRVLQMLWRLNFLVLFLCLTQGTTYILYYICLLHTYYFGVVYVSMKVGSHLNYQKWGLRVKLAIVAVIILFVWDFNSDLFQMIHFPFFGEEPMVGATSGSMWEWYFRSSLDHWSAFLGMVFALNYPITSLFYRKLEAQPLVWHVLGKGVVGLSLLAALYVWVTGPYQQSKQDYNQTNAYFGFIPIIVYVYFRNLTPSLRSHHLDTLKQIGKTTLETYLMQHHVWLTSNAKSLLTLIPGWPKTNMFVVTVIYFLLSRKLYRLTMYLRGIALPSNSKQQCFKNLTILGVGIGGFMALAMALKAFDFLTLTAIGIVSAVCGLLLYQYVMDLTWEGFKESAMATREPTLEETMLEKMVGEGAGQPKYDTPLNSISAPIVGAMTLLVFGLAWHGLSQVGASKLGPLPATCDAFVNDGTWVAVDACNEESRAAGQRKYGISSFATCDAQDESYVWAWNQTHPSSQCRFTHRDTKNIRKAVNYRTFTFVGDSMTRHVYQAFLRQMGIAGAGAYNTKGPKWADIDNRIGDTFVEFKWAPVVADLLANMKEIMGRPEEATDKSSARPDLVIMGGGAWDRLHVHATDEDGESHQAAVKTLAKEIRLARNDDIPIVWFVPTTMNSKALPTEEKRKNIPEDQMAAMRALYEDLGVLSSASFVIDGPSFTATRVEESYDGVHYPLSVYDAGAQILANALDWLLPDPIEDVFIAPEPGMMANPSLGVMMLCFIFMGLFCFDGFLGFSYMAAFFGRRLMPTDICDAAYEELREKHDLPEDHESVVHSISGPVGNSTMSMSSSYVSGMSGGQRSDISRDPTERSRRSARSGRSGTSRRSRTSEGSNRTGRSSKSGRASADSDGSIDAEIAALLGTTSKRLEMTDIRET